MDAREYFQLIVRPNYYEFYGAQNSIRLLWNTIVSMNTVPEYLVLDRLKYPLELKREVLDAEAQKVREELGLTELQYCANTFKHVRKLPRGHSNATASSTNIEPIDLATWVLDGHDLVQVAHSAFATLSKIPQLNAPST
jgi:hypothetical protein